MIPSANRHHSFESTRPGAAASWLKTFKRAQLSRRPSDASNTGGFNARRGANRTANSALARRLKGRHLQMIAIGGSIGAGLWIGTGKILAESGPASVLLAYLVVGFVGYCTVHAMGELATLFPVAGSFATYGTRFIDPAWGFAMGWNYAMNWLVVLPLEIIAALKILEFWSALKIPEAATITIFLVTIFGINLGGVRTYGEAEFTTSLIKAAAIIGFILLGIVINCTGNQTSGYIGFSLWRGSPGAFNNGFKGFSTGLITAAFSYAGTEMLGLAAAETMNPTKHIPLAIRQVFWRISMFYVLSVFVVGLIVPSDDARLVGNGNDSSTSPFIIAIQDAGISGLDSAMNAVILISVLSVANTAFFASSRVLAAMADQQQAPRFLGYIDRRGRPLAAVAVALLVGLLSYMGTGVQTDVILAWLIQLSGLSCLFSWASICLAHIRFRRAWRYRGHSLDELVYRSPVGTAGSHAALWLLAMVLAAQVWVAVDPIEEVSGVIERVQSVFQALLAVPVVVLFYLFFKFRFRTTWLGIEQIDVDTGRYQRSGKRLGPLKAGGSPWWMKVAEHLC